mgnify:CR=1 FL=1
MDLETYCREIQKCASVIQKHLYFITRSYVKECIAQGPVNSISSSVVTFIDDFTKIITPFGTIQTCTGSSVSSQQYKAFEEAKARIAQELGLVEKQKKITTWSEKYVFYETYYELPTLQLEGTHTREEVHEVWKRIQ